MNRTTPALAETAVIHPTAVTTAHAHATLAPLPGAELVTVPGVGHVWAYTNQPPPPAPPKAVEPLPAWVKATALLMPSAACSVAVAAWGLSLAVGAFEAITAALWALAGATATVGVAVGGAALAWRNRRQAGTGPATATATATATSRSIIGGKATATATATIKQR